MRKRIIIVTVTAAALVSLIALERACAYWIWTPETKKFVNPKYAAKDSPKEQFDWAMSFYQAKDYQKAAQEFEKLTKHYEYSEYASKAQYYVGLCYENMNKLYFAFQNYQKAIDNFPHIENMEEIIAREFNIANIYEGKASPRVLGTDIMTSTDRAVEIYKKVVDNAPFGRLADESQFRMGQALKKSDRFDEAIPAFQKILDDYPNSQFTDKAKFEVADCAYKASLKPAYDIESTDKAIKAFEDFSQGNKDEKLSGEAGKTIQRLKDKAAEKSFVTAQFYESQRHYESAIIYYKDVVARFPDSSLAVKARAKIEELSNRGRKIVQGDAGKEGEKKSWQFFKFAKPAKKEKPEDIPAPKPEKPKGLWTPLKFTTMPKQEETPVRPETMAATIETAEVKPVEKEVSSPKTAVSAQETVTIQEAATQPIHSAVKKKKGWAPLSFTKREKPSEPAVVKEETKTQKKGWTPFSFAKPAKKEKIEDTPVTKTEKSNPWWNPFKSTAKPKEEQPTQPIHSAVKKKKGWAPLSFTKREKPSEPAVVKEETKARATETEPVEETPVRAEVAPPIVETAAAYQATARQETVIIQDDVVIRKTQ